MRINNLELPEKLVDLINTNRWNKFDESSMQSVFPDQLLHVMLYDDYKMIENETSFLIDEYKKKRTSYLDFNWFGEKSNDVIPGDLDPNYCVVIGNIGQDMTFALDYRNNLNNPSVVYFNNHLLWVKIDDSFNSFVQRIGIYD